MNCTEMSEGGKTSLLKKQFRATWSLRPLLLTAMLFYRLGMTEAESVVCPLDTVDVVEERMQNSWKLRDGLSVKAEELAAYVLLSLF